MGFFDFRCPVSGLSLRAADATHVALIEVTPDRWSPLTLPLTGSYDRGGSVDGFTPDFRTTLWVAGFTRFAQAGRLAAPRSEELGAFERAPSIAGLLELFERVNTMSRWGTVPFTLDGCQLRQVLIHAEVFAALAPATRPRTPTREQLAAQLAGAPVAPQARELYEQTLSADDAVRTATSVALAQLTRLGESLEQRGLRWSPAAESGQFYPDDDLKFAHEAKRALAGSAALLRVVDREIAGLEREAAE